MVEVLLQALWFPPTLIITAILNCLNKKCKNKTKVSFSYHLKSWENNEVKGPYRRSCNE